MVKFIFDLDGTITKEETLPIISNHFKVQEQIEKLTDATVCGNIPFVESFIRRVFVLGEFPIDEINNLLENVKLHERILSFIKQHSEQCCIATGNLACWVEKLSKRIGCEFYCSEGKIDHNRVVKLERILKKEEVVKKYKAEGYKVVFVGDGNNDIEAMRYSDIAIASAITHQPVQGVLAVADYLILNEVTLCRQLNQLL